jgi:hypothetical protein
MSRTRLLCWPLQVRASASAEATDLRAALDAAGADKANLSEKLAVLKTQLCFALQVGCKRQQCAAQCSCVCW